MAATAALVALAGCASANRVEASGSSCGMNFRWLNNAGFELVLRSGAHVLVDPWLDSARFFPVPLASIERADYLLVTHIHFDHAEDVGAVQRKFPQVRIFTGSLAAEPLARWQKLDLSRLYKVSDGQEFRFDDVTIKAFAGRHTESNQGNIPTWEADGRMSIGSVGLFDLYQFLVTDADGTKFMVWGGTPSVDNVYRLTGLKPDVAAVHISPKQDFGILSRMVNALDPQVLMPHHYDIWPTILRTRPAEAQQFPVEVQPVTPDNVIRKTMAFVADRLKEGNVKAAYFLPEHHAWYHYDKAARKVVPGACKQGG